MGHRDDFYVRANIIGVTGPVHELPSVYFQNDSGEYGHITQVHCYSFNWGRTEVKNDSGWQITNVCPKTRGRACTGTHHDQSHEINGEGKVFHVSRSKFIPWNELTENEQNVAAEAIFRCPYAKSDPLYSEARRKDEERYKKLWADRHRKGPGGRRGAIDYTGEGLANEVLKIAHPKRA